MKKFTKGIIALTSAIAIPAVATKVFLTAYEKHRAKKSAGDVDYILSRKHKELIREATERDFLCDRFAESMTRLKDAIDSGDSVAILSAYTSSSMYGKRLLRGFEMDDDTFGSFSSDSFWGTNLFGCSDLVSQINDDIRDINNPDLDDVFAGVADFDDSGFDVTGFGATGFGEADTAFGSAGTEAKED